MKSSEVPQEKDDQISHLLVLEHRKKGRNSNHRAGSSCALSSIDMNELNNLRVLNNKEQTLTFRQNQLGNVQKQQTRPVKPSHQSFDVNALKKCTQDEPVHISRQSLVSYQQSLKETDGEKQQNEYNDES